MSVRPDLGALRTVMGRQASRSWRHSGEGRRVQSDGFKMNILLVGEDAAGMQMLQHLRRTSHRIAGVMASPPRQDRPGATVWSLASKFGYNIWPSKMVKDPAFAARIVEENVDILLNVHSLFL